MHSKLIKTGEYGYNPFYRLTTYKDYVLVVALDYNKKEVDRRGFEFDNLENLEFYMEEETTCYYASKAREWVVSTKEWKDAL